MSKAEEYLKNNVKGILQPMVSAVLLEKPKDPVKKNYIIKLLFFKHFLYIDSFYDTMATKLFWNKI